jgi:hypothetical protein
VRDPKNGGDLWVFTFDDKKAAPLIATTFNETHAQISGDGKWIAFTSNSTGRKEIHVQPFPAGSGRWRVSDNGGDWPRWKRDGTELYYHAIGNNTSPGVNFGAGAFGGPVYMASIDTSSGIVEPGPPREVLVFPALNLTHSGGDYHMYAVSPDGNRFPVAQWVASTGGATGQLGPDMLSGLTVALNWTGGLKE